MKSVRDLAVAFITLLFVSAVAWAQSEEAPGATEGEAEATTGDEGSADTPPASEFEEDFEEIVFEEWVTDRSEWDNMEPSIPSLSQDQVDRLNAGEVIIDVVDQRVPIGDAMGVIDYPPEPTIRVLEDFNTHHEFMSDLIVSEVRGEENGDKLCYGVTATPWPMDNRDYMNRARGGPTTLDGIRVILVLFEYIEDSGNIADARGWWMALPWGEDGSKTLLRFRLQIDIGSWLPDFLKNWGTEHFLPLKITDIRARVTTVLGD